MSQPRTLFCRILKVGIGVNMLLAVPALIAPAWALSIFSIPQPGPLVYAQFAAFLVILLSIFYVPAALDPDRYRLVAWLTVLARMAAAIFFTTAAIWLGERVFFLPALLDFSFSLAQGIPLILWVRADNRPQSPKHTAMGLLGRSDSAAKQAQEADTARAFDRMERV